MMSREQLRRMIKDGKITLSDIRMLWIHLKDFTDGGADLKSDCPESLRILEVAVEDAGLIPSHCKKHIISLLDRVNNNLGCKKNEETGRKKKVNREEKE